MPSLPLLGLHAEQDLSQAEFPGKVGSDARQDSCYENGRVASGVGAMARIPETFSTGNAFDARLGKLTDDERTPFSPSSVPPPGQGSALITCGTS